MDKQSKHSTQPSPQIRVAVSSQTGMLRGSPSPLLPRLEQDSPQEIRLLLMESLLLARYPLCSESHTTILIVPVVRGWDLRAVRLLKSELIASMEVVQHLPCRCLVWQLTRLATE